MINSSQGTDKVYFSVSWDVYVKGVYFYGKDMETIVSLAKHRGFVFPGSDIYGGLSNTWDYGPWSRIKK